MVVGLYTFPPLGRVFLAKTQTITLSVLLEVADSDADKSWEICLWYSSGGQPWQETPLSPAPSTHFSVCLPQGNLNHRYLSYNLTLPAIPSLRFTFKFRSDPTLPWTWAQDELGTGDGLIISNVASHPPTDDLSNVIHGLNPELKVTPVSSQTPRTQLWTVEATVGPASDDTSGYADIELGTPWGGFVRYFALVRHVTEWLGPRHGKSHFSLDKDALLCSFLSHEGKHVVLLGISNRHNITTLLRSSKEGPVMIHLRNDGNASSAGMLLAAVGDDCESAIAATMYHARSMFSSAYETLPQEPSIQGHDVESEWMQNWYDGLGYCTWNALGLHLSEEKIVQAVDSLKKNNINITNLIIDDNWQDVDYKGPNARSYRWKSFEAEPKAFPNGLKHTVSQIRSRFPSIEHVAVWHALFGYWGGISPHGDIGRQYQTVQVHLKDSSVDGPMTVVAKAEVEKFYDDFYRFLSSCGVDGVKTDAQCMLDHLTSAKHRRELTNPYLDAWTRAYLLHFGARAISCMSQVPQILFRQQLPQRRPPIPVRNSDDYYPNVADSHPWHIWANAHNSLFTHHLNVLPDWDMFQTHHERAGYHAAARCVSGGPVCITDIPGQHDFDLINRMTSLTTRGKTIVLRPSVFGKTIDAYTGYDEDALLKVGCYHGKSATGTPILALFNTRPHTLTEIIPLEYFPGAVASAEYVVRSYNSGMVVGTMDRGFQMTRLGVRLEKGGYDIFTAYPVTQFDSETNGRIDVALLGLIDKMTGAAAIIDYQFKILPTGRIIAEARLKALGTMGMYISSLPDMSIERDFIIFIRDQPIPRHVVTVDQNDSHVLAVDLEAAWKEMKFDPRWNNEIEVKVYFDAEHP